MARVSTFITLSSFMLDGCAGFPVACSPLDVCIRFALALSLSLPPCWVCRFPCVSRLASFRLSSCWVGLPGLPQPVSPLSLCTSSCWMSPSLCLHSCWKVSCGFSGASVSTLPWSPFLLDLSAGFPVVCVSDCLPSCWTRLPGFLPASSLVSLVPLHIGWVCGVSCVGCVSACLSLSPFMLDGSSGFAVADLVSFSLPSCWMGSAGFPVARVSTCLPLLRFAGFARPCCGEFLQVASFALNPQP